MEKSIKYSQDQSSIMLLFEHNFFWFQWRWRLKPNAQIFEHKLYITLLLTNPKQISWGRLECYCKVDFGSETFYIKAQLS